MRDDEIERLKQDHEAFLANISHEIRTPLNGILGLSELLLHMELTEKQQKYVKNIFESSETLLALVNDLLDLSAMQRGTLKVEKSVTNLPELLKEVVLLFSEKAIAKGLDLHLYYPKELPQIVMTDPVRVREILIQLVSNAIKFTHHGEIIVGALGSPIELFIADTGIGIPQNLQERIFEKFFQANTTTTRQYGGTGLGLTLTKSLTERMGGRVSFKTKEGKGSIFSLHMPFKEAETSPVFSDEVWSCLKGKRILIVSASDVEGFIFCRSLNFAESIPTLALTKEAGLEELRKARFSNLPFDLILMNIDLSQDWVPVLMDFQKEADLHGAKILMNDWGKKWTRSVIIESALPCHFVPKPTLPVDLFRKLTELFTPSKMTS